MIRKIMLFTIVTLLIPIVGLLSYIFLGGPKLPPETDAIIDEVMQSELPELVVGQTGFVTSDGLQIWYESISPLGPQKGTVMLINGGGGDSLEWPPKFVRALVGTGYRVIRFDNRGVGMSDRVTNWDRKNPYTVSDMAGDALAVMQALDVGEAHLIGLSMGGIIAQEIAIDHPEKVSSLTLMSSSGYIGDPDLPTLSSSYFISSILKGIPLLKYRLLGGERNLVKERIAKVVAFMGSEDLDIRETTELVLYGLRERRGISIQGARQHLAAVTVSGSRYEKLQTLNVPTLVIHGTVDPMNPIEHGKKLVEVIPNAEGLWLDNVGHVFPYPNMDSVNERVLSHIANYSGL
jgi:pimeloyl-ACP methyl ester carboxylesterase